MGIENEDFSDVLDGAMQSTEEEIPDIFDSGEGGGGDIDEPVAEQPEKLEARTREDKPEAPAGNQLNLDQLRSEKIQKAEMLVKDWTSERDRREQAYKDAQDAYRKARKAAVDDGADEEQEFRAQESVMDARIALDKANDGYGQAVGWQQQVRDEPQLSIAQKAWVEANPKYMDDTAFQRRANSIMSKLREEGYDDTRAPFFDRVNQALREKQRMGQDRRLSSGAPAIRTSMTGGDKANNKISDGEKRFIQRLGYNPNDERVQKQYIGSRNNTRAAAQRKGAI